MKVDLYPLSHTTGKKKKKSAQVTALYVRARSTEHPEESISESRHALGDGGDLI